LVGQLSAIERNIMALYKRGKTWWVRFTAPDGTPVRESTKTDNDKLAEQYEAKRKHDLFMEDKMGIKADRSFSEASKHFLAVKDDLRSVNCYEQQLKWWAEQFKNVTLQKIDEDIITTAIMAKKQEGASNATLNRYLAALRATLNEAERRRWIMRAPVIAEFSEPKERVRWLTDEEATNLLAACPEHWRGMVRMSLATGLRQSNVRAMRWTWVDFERETLTIPGEFFKNGKDFAIPLSEEALAVLRAEQGKHDEFVFTWHGDPITQISHTAWKATLARAGIENFRWHDMRHTWATRMTRKNVPTQALQKLGGWETMAMVNKYAHHDVESLRNFVQDLSKPTEKNVAQDIDSKEAPHKSSTIDSVGKRSHLRLVA
jgi:integrase